MGPLDFHDRFNLTLPPDKRTLQHQLQDLVRFTKEHSMVLNSKKTKCMPFVNSLTKDFMPQLSIEPSNYLEVIYQLKLVGVVLTCDMTWNAHVDYTVSRVNRTLWQLVRFKQLGASQEKLKTFYNLKIRSILMFASVCFHSSLKSELSQKLELQQKRSLAVILGSQYRSYSHALAVTCLPRLDTLRSEGCTKWALKAQRDPLQSDIFPLNTSTVNTRFRNKFKEYFCHTMKFYKSTIPRMIRNLNDIYSKYDNT